MLHIVLQTEAIVCSPLSSILLIVYGRKKAGWLMLVLLALSVVAVYIFGERLVAMRRWSKVELQWRTHQGIYIRRQD